jgi:parvulin-like peptidyl-prolyl isomerase
MFAFGEGCKKQAPGEGESADRADAPDGKNSVILKVSDSFYFNSDFEKYLLSIAGQEYKQLSVSSLSRLFDDFIDEMILLQAARNQETSLTVEEQKEYLAKLARESWSNGKKSPLDDIEYETLLEKIVIEKYLSQQIDKIDITDEEVKEYYELHKREFLRPERVRVSQILLKTESKAVEILERVKSTDGEAFQEIARVCNLLMGTIYSGWMRNWSRNWFLRTALFLRSRLKYLTRGFNNFFEITWRA